MRRLNLPLISREIRILGRRWKSEISHYDRSQASVKGQVRNFLLVPPSQTAAKAGKVRSTKVHPIPREALT
jgi:hypothetical protein